jgi:phosphoenolpyruvate---glycerone phosphotransferase subunit DhaL
MLKAKQIVEILCYTAEKIEEQKSLLSELDAAIGDGDHGFNMHKGFSQVVEKLKDEESEDIGDILKKAGMALVSSVGGASGPLYGTAFLKASNVLKGKKEMDIHDFQAALTEAIGGIVMRGKAEQHEKTMLDALIPAKVALEVVIQENKSTIECLEAMKNAAIEGVEYTATIVAKKGRASYVGERSIGHKDAGAMSSALILTSIYEYMMKEGQ